MLNVHLYRLLEGFRQVKDLPGVRFAVTVARNKRMVSARVEDLDKGKEPSEQYQAYTLAEVGLLREHAKKDDKGEPVSTTTPDGRQGYEVKDQVNFEADHSLLVKEHQKAVDDHAEKMKVFMELLEEECDITLVRVTEKDLPEGLTPMMAANIIEMLS